MAKSIDIKHPRALHRALGVPDGQKIPEAKIQQALHSGDPHRRAQAQFAENAEHFDHHGAVQQHIDHHNTHGHGTD